MDYFICWLGGLLFYIQDSAASEEVEQITQPSLNDNISVESVSSFLSSGMLFIVIY